MKGGELGGAAVQPLIEDPSSDHVALHEAVAEKPLLDEAVDLVHRMVSIQSESGDEAELAEFLVEQMARHGLDTHVDGAGNAVGTLGAGDRHLVLLGHLDTVPGGPTVGIRDGLLYGRGAVDAKGPLAAFVMAVAGFSQGAFELPENLRLTVIGAVEEEISSSKGARFVAERLRPGACVIGEPSSSSAVTLGYKGRLLMDLERSLPTSHSAGPEPTAAAWVVEDWNRVSAEIAELNAGVEGIFGTVQTELQSIHSERSGNAELCRATFGFRLPPAWGPDRIEPLLRQSILGAEVSFRGRERAWTSPRTDPLARAFTSAIRAETGERPRLKYKTGTSDMNVVGPVWGCPIVAYGPGDSSLDHTPHEHLDLEEFGESIRVLAEAVRRWAR